MPRGPTSGQANAPGDSILRRLARLARALLKQGALGAIQFVTARPRLDEFLRRQIYRFPRLAGRVRGAVAFSRRSTWQSLPPALSDEAELTDSARQVLQDLELAIKHQRTQ